MRYIRHLLIISLAAVSLSQTPLHAQPLNNKRGQRLGAEELSLPFHKPMPHQERKHDQERARHLPEKRRMLFEHGRAFQDTDSLTPFNDERPANLHVRADNSPRHTLQLVTSDVCGESLAVAWTSNYASWLVSPSDQADALATDSSGNIYVTGSSDGDYVTMKYDSMGVEQWAARYNGPANSYDGARAIALDGSGNVYVTGRSYGSGTSADYATVKYNSSGVEQWVARYNGPGNFDDDATAIALDGSGNVYVTGYSYSSVTSADYATVKYNSSGVEQWAARYNGPGNDYDEATAIAVDGSGNVYVTGYSYSSVTSSDYATVKYNSSGVEQWAARYNGPGNSDDRAAAIALDGSGNVYVTGYSYGSGTSYDYATVKYNSSGVEQWAARYNGPGNGYDVATAIALDGTGNVYVTGYSWGSVTSSDYATVKYNSSGVEQWAARYDGPGNSDDRAVAIALDGSGNVYVTGYNYGSSTSSDYATVKYNSSGVEQWVARYNGPGNDYDRAAAIALDGSGNVYVTGYSYSSSTSSDYATVKYNSSGVEQWAARYNGPANSDDRAVAIALDGSGNVYVTGYSYGSVTSSDYATVKYNSSGVEQWAARYNGPANSYDEATAIVLDGSGNVYVTGVSYGSGTSSDYATVKYNSSGVEQWAVRYNGPGNSEDRAAAIALDGSGNVYVTGSSVGSTSFDYATVKYNSSGVEQWAARYNGPDNYADGAAAIALDGSGNVYVTGVSDGSGALYDYATVKYNSSGVEQWAARYNGPDNSYDHSYAIALDGSGNVYVTGGSVGSVTSYDYATVKYNSSGVEQWAARYNGPGNSDDDATAIALDGSGNVYVTGYSYSSTDYDYATVKYNSSGVRQWAARYNGPGNFYDVARAIALDGSSNVYVTGYSYSSSTSSDYATVKYNSSGVEQWAARYNGPGNSSDGAAAIALDGSGNVYVTGTTGFSDGAQYTTIRYNRTTIGYAYHQRWNMVSLPKRVSDPSRTAIFPSSVSSLFEYSGGYIQRESLQIGKGYWLKFPSDLCILTISGDTVTTDSVNVTEGWNLIGSLTTPITVTDVTSDPPGLITSSFFGDNGGSYVTTSSIEPGEGYWVKVNQNGRLIFSSSGNVPSHAKITISPTSELPPPPPDGEIASPKQRIPTQFALEQNYPNPFNPVTVIRYAISVRAIHESPVHVTLKVYDVLGQEVTTLIDGIQDAGYKSVEFDGSSLTSGVFYYRLESGSFRETKKLMLLR